jgi:hypothetical protein
MELSDLLELSGLGLFVWGIFLLTGPAGAVLAGAFALFVLGMSLDGSDVYPLRVLRSDIAWLRRKVKRERV